MHDEHLLTIVTLGPAAAACLLGLLPGRLERLHRWLALFASLLIFGLSCLVWTAFDPDNPGFQLQAHADWIPEYGVSYHLGVDGVSLLLVLLTTLLTPVVILSSWTSITTWTWSAS